MFNRIYIAAIGILILALGMATMRIRHLENKVDQQIAHIAQLDMEARIQIEREAVIEEFRTVTEGVAASAAATCERLIELRVTNSVQAMEIENAPDSDGAIDAYDRLLCQRPEAAGHSKCAAPATPVPE